MFHASLTMQPFDLALTRTIFFKLRLLILEAQKQVQMYKLELLNQHILKEENTIIVQTSSF
jgi:hypothetical protein